MKLIYFAFLLHSFDLASNGAGTSVTLSSSANPAIFGQPVTLTASVTPSAATGSITFYDGVAILGIRTLMGGVATLKTGLVPSGTQSLHAYYSGDSNDSPSSSPMFAETVRAIPGQGLGAAIPYATPGFPANISMNIAIADFNNDGKPDIAIVQISPAVLSVFIGNGDGTFQAPLNRPVQNAGAIAVGDFNGDGNPDVVIANQDGSVGVYAGNGEGTFQDPINSPGFGSPQVTLTYLEFAVADFNGDGKADLAISDAVNGITGVLLGNGDGTFRSGASYTGFSGALVAYDFNNDGMPDIAVAGLILLGNGDGTFKSPVKSYPANAVYLAEADFNEDGNADLAISSESGITVLLGRGDGTFQTGTTMNLGLAAPMAVGDFDGDGAPDLAIRNTGSGGSLQILYGNGDGTFKPPVAWQAGSPPQSILVADFNGDGRADVNIMDFGHQNFRILFGAADAANLSFSASPNPSFYGQPVTLTASLPASATGQVSFYDTTGSSSTFTSLALVGTATVINDSASITITSLPAGSRSLYASYSGDRTYAQATSETITQVVNYAGATVSLTSSVNPSTFGQPVTLTATVSLALPGARVTFYDGTTVLGDAPVTGGVATFTTTLLPAGLQQLAAHYSANSPGISASLVQTVKTLPENGFLAGVAYQTGANPNGVVVGDFNRDGKADIAISRGLPGVLGSQSGISVLLGNGDGTFRPAGDYNNGSATSSIVSADFNGDGIPDLAVSGGVEVGIELFYGNGDGTFQIPPLQQLSGPYGATGLSVADRNGTGIPVLAGGIFNGIGFSPFFGNCGGFLFIAPIDFTMTADFNGDGIPDLAFTIGESYPNQPLYVLPTPTDRSCPHLLQPSINTGPVAVADFNGDKIPDLAGTSGVWLGNGDGTFRNPILYPGGALGLGAAGDFNGDGITDFAAPNANGQVSVLLGKGDGSFQSPMNYKAGSNPLPYLPFNQTGLIAVGDFNGDGRPDLAVVNPADNAVIILLGAPASVSAYTITSIASGLQYPAGVAVDSGGNVYFADTYNSRIAKIAAGTGVITTVAGNGVAGFSGDGGLAVNASLNYPYGVAVDASGNVYIADSGNNRIRKVTAATGVITTVAGNGASGFSGDGGAATSAALNYPLGVAVDGSGNVYIADTFDSAVRKVAAATGAITTIAGSGTLNHPFGVAVDGTGNVYIADSYNQRIEKLTSTGVLSMIAGNGVGRVQRRWRRRHKRRSCLPVRSGC